MKWVQGRLRPLRRKLSSGDIVPTDGLAPILGKDLAHKLVGLMCRAVIRSAASPREERKVRSTAEIDEFGESGTRIYGSQFSAIVRVDAVPLRPETHQDVVGIVLLLLAILDHVPAGSRRAWHRALWLGTPGAVLGLAGRLGRSVRTVERWLAVLRTIGVLKNWQPPASEAKEYQKTRNGRTYSLYELGEMSPEWAKWQKAGLKAEASRTRTAQHDLGSARNDPPRSEAGTVFQKMALEAMAAAPREAPS